ncbi:MAG: FAD-linked oxidase C-terminal domain-containing protein [SAR202 cluster bacterium]|nr:FAD-linked oxidase C-terminal domain-containing protein [SAR202 cluster bacterium]MDP6715094.1 FAD-linked oxidase C-terminal domain-containing protein [SAR202 cluster bacterium]
MTSVQNAALQELRQVVGDEYVIHTPEDLIVFEYDGAVDKATPLAVVIPDTAQQVSECVKAARRHSLPVIARGAGTGLSGGAIAEHGGIVIAMTRMTKVLEVDTENRIAVVEPGVVNIDLTTHVAPLGLYYAPDPSSQRACTIGGNVAENSGGPHCLAYGVTTNHVLGMEVVLADGTIQWIGGRTRESVGYDLRGILVGSEGTLAIVTKVIVRLLTQPESVKTLLAIFNDLDDASAAVSGIIGAGIVPAAIEMMDDLCIRAAEASVHAGYPEEAGAVLLVEVDGITEAVEEEVEAVEEVCNRFNPIEIRTATDAEEREKLWSGRKGVLGALGRLAPNYLLVDGTVPRTKLVEVLSKIRQMSVDTGYPIANLLHAGDGNLHPSVLFDERIPGDTQRALEIGGEILELCVEVGGVLSGEHGIGLEKQDHMPLMFNDADLSVMAKLKPSFATEDSLNPGKVFPTGATCGDLRQAAAIARVGPGAYV